MDKNGFDERQILNRYKIGFQSFILIVFLILLESCVHITGFNLSDNANGAVIIVLVAMTFFTTRAILSDAFYSVRVAFRINFLMIFFSAMAIYFIVSFAFDMFSGVKLIESDRLTRECVFLATTAYTFIISTTYWIKRAKENQLEKL